MESFFSMNHSILITLCFLIFFTSLSTSQIRLNSTLYASNVNQTWPSTKSTFSVGFTQLGPSRFVAAVNYIGGADGAGIPVWVAGGIDTTVDSGGSFHLRPNGLLQLVNGSGAAVWDSGTGGRSVTSASIDDNGNLVLSNRSTSVWSTFENPTDTIVPGQNFTVNQALRSGDYGFRLLDSGNLTLIWNDSIVYWNQGLNSTVNTSLSSPVLSLQQLGILQISDSELTSPYIMAYSSDYAEGSDVLRFLRLDSDGNLRIYSSARGSGVITSRWAGVSDQCQVFGYCGNMGVCSYNYSSSEPDCGCPSQNFELIDASNSRKGCRRKVEINDCPGSATMLQLENAKFLTYPPELSNQVFFVGISACRLNCLVGSSCVASTALSDGTGLCYLKTTEFVSGYKNPSLPSTSYVKVCGPLQLNPSPDTGLERDSQGSRLKAWVILLVILATLLLLIAVEGGFWWLCCRNSPKFGTLSAQYALLEYASGAPVQFSYKDLHRSTKGFKEKLGAGGFGAVYKGVLANKTVVGVKQLEGIEQGEKQFRMEVATISSTHHLNLVRLIGFCSEGRHRLLVYEFMKNGSLDNFLFTTEEQPGKFLDWETRFSIALGTARGITYLHEECRDCIIHCDIKPENILLDENYNAKVSDFGLAKLVNPKDHRYRTLTSVRGTRGYLAPEWLANLPITSKSDIYSYGMVLLELVSGRRNFDVSDDTNRKKFSIWAYEEFEKGNIDAIIDKRLTAHDVDKEQVTRAIQASFWCIQEQPAQRPTMGKVVQMLEGITDIEKPPAPKAVVEGSIGGTSINISSNVSALSTHTGSAPAPSSSSSFQTAGISPLPPPKTTDKASSSLLHSGPM